MNNVLSKEDLESLINEVKALENSVLMRVTKERIEINKDICATMPIYDNETMAKREFFRGVGSGMEWFTKDVVTFIDQENQLLQKEEK